MQRYRNLSGSSGVRAFENGVDYIKVQFKDGMIYTYNYIRTGATKVERMKSLAARGSGLNSYINVYAKFSYANKSRY